MKTNASSKTIVKAVETVSANKYDNNVVFRRYPSKITKNINVFTLRTIDAKKLGSITTKTGQRQPKANWDVHQDVMNEIFRIDNRPNIFVDTIYGRQHNANPVHELSVNELAEDTSPAVLVDSSDAPRVKRKYTKKADKLKLEKEDKPSDKKLSDFIKSMRYFMNHPNLIK